MSARRWRANAQQCRMTFLDEDFYNILRFGLPAPRHFYALQSYFGAMKISLYRARQLSLALLVVAVVDHGHLHNDYSGAAPNSSGLLRLGRDLLRRSGGETGEDARASKLERRVLHT